MREPRDSLCKSGSKPVTLYCQTPSYAATVVWMNNDRSITSEKKTSKSIIHSIDIPCLMLYHTAMISCVAEWSTGRVRSNRATIKVLGKANDKSK